MEWGGGGQCLMFAHKRQQNERNIPAEGILTNIYIPYINIYICIYIYICTEYAQ
jgi:hypothetical protein